jgi:prophage regulatory protein
MVIIRASQQDSLSLLATHLIIGAQMITKEINSPRQLPATGFIRQAELLKFVPFSKATLWRRCASLDFPTPVKLGPRITGWRCEDVREWMQAVGGKA